LAGAAGERDDRRAGGARRVTPQILVAEPWADYGLVDSGDGRKLERYGPLPLHPPRSAGPVGAGRAGLGGGRRVHPWLGRRGRRALGL
jgi:hypothetical protein